MSYYLSARTTARLTSDQREWLSAHRAAFRRHVALEKARRDARKVRHDTEEAYLFALRLAMEGVR